MRFAADTAIDRELLAENFDRLHPPRRQIARAHDGMPKQAKITSRRRPRPNGLEIGEFKLSFQSHE
jgi:hypothetical protein